MGLVEVQKTLARLYTDNRLRADFFADPSRVGRELGLSAEETRRLAQLSAIEVNKFADTLTGKRLLGVGKLLPFTRRVLKEEFDAHFRRFASEQKQTGAPNYFADADRFAVYLEAALRRAERAEPWVLDLLRFESARVEAAASRRRLVVRYFRHDIGRLVGSLARRAESPSVVRRPSLAIWWRRGRSAPVRYALLSAPRLPSLKLSRRSTS
jgi:hypothetical protein